ncbi:MAG: hypothetical protein Q3998_04965 [Porphyromonas sp.]|nr:hypothetical protein [Porphyromonas sp.]
MKGKNLLGVFLLLFCAGVLVSCSQDIDSESKGFMSKATVVENQGGGFLCYLDGGGVVTSNSPVLKGIERGYFAFLYKEHQRKTSGKKELFVENALVSPYMKYSVIHPLTLDEANESGITNPANSEESTSFSLSGAYRGFIDVTVGTSVQEGFTGEEVMTKVSLVYDPARQSPNTLLLKLYRNPGVSKDWASKKVNKETLSCDISSLRTLQHWADSVEVIIEGDKENHYIKIAKEDFSKPELGL